MLNIIANVAPSPLFVLGLIVIYCLVLLKAEKENYYEILGIPIDATESEIKKSYRKLALELHPDKLNTSNNTGISVEEARERFLKIQEAYEVVES
jgi:curved DNA-binding protein CbpA